MGFPDHKTTASPTRKDVHPVQKAEKNAHKIYFLSALTMFLGLNMGFTDHKVFLRPQNDPTRPKTDKIAHKHHFLFLWGAQHLLYRNKSVHFH